MLLFVRTLLILAATGLAYFDPNSPCVPCELLLVRTETDVLSAVCIFSSADTGQAQQRRRAEA